MLSVRELQPLPFGARQSRDGALAVAEVPRVVAKVELRQVARQVGRADVVIDAIDPALEDREEVLGRVRVNVATDVLVNVIDRLMGGELSRQALVRRVGVRVKSGPRERRCDG